VFGHHIILQRGIDVQRMSHAIGTNASTSKHRETKLVHRQPLLEQGMQLAECPISVQSPACGMLLEQG